MPDSDTMETMDRWKGYLYAVRSIPDFAMTLAMFGFSYRIVAHPEIAKSIMVDSIATSGRLYISYPDGARRVIQGEDVTFLEEDDLLSRIDLAKAREFASNKIYLHDGWYRKDG